MATKQNARNLLIKRSALADGTGARGNVCGIRTRSWSIANAEIDTTIPNCDDPSLPLVTTSEPGAQTLEFTGDGIFEDSTASILVADDARLQRSPIYEVIVPGYGTWVGPMSVFNYQWNGDQAEKLQFSATWRPTDASLLTFTPAP
jgi:predicted secreted protein